MKLRLFKSRFVNQLKNSVRANIEFYKTKDFLWTLEPEHAQNFIEIDAPWFTLDGISQLNSAASGMVTDAVDAKILFESLKEMPPALARDERVWSTLCHLYAQPYIRARHKAALSDDESDEFVKGVVSRYFADNPRAYERTNALARLWWFGFVASRSSLDFEKTLDVLLSYTDFRASIIERPLVFCSQNIFDAVLSVAMDHKEAGDDLHVDRDRYRPLFGELTEAGGRIFFPTMKREKLITWIENHIPEQQSKV